MKIVKIGLLLFLFLTAIWNCKSRDAERPISPQEIEAHIRFLSDDLLEGRAVGSRGLSLAALYQENHFRSHGMEPAFGESYRQPFALIGSSPDTNASFVIFSDDISLPCAIRKDFVVNSFREDNPEGVEGELVYCGYLIQAPERDWDDIKGEDLKGKVLLVEINEPGNYPQGIFEGEDLTYYGRWTSKIEKASELGATGVLIIHSPKGAGYGWEVVQNSWSGEHFFLPDVKKRPFFQGWIQEQTVEKAMASAGFDREELAFQAEKKEFQPVSLGLRVRVRQKPVFRSVETENVAAVLKREGRGKEGRYIILSAHYDHLGLDPNREGDQIYNGAVDNSSASAVMLALARFYSAHKNRLKANLIFLAATAEEEGLLGSDYFAGHLPVPSSSVLANLNFEMTNVWGETEDVYAIGAKHSDLDEICGRAAGAMGLRYIPERNGELGFFFRSDQLSFVKAGIPAVWLHEGITSRGNDKEFIQRKDREYKMSRYHKVADEIEEDWDLRGTVQIAEWAQEIIALLAGEEGLPQFKPASSFSRKN